MTYAPSPAVAVGAPARPRRSVWKSLLLPWLLLAALGSLWALATPIGGSPDEPAHVVKAGSVVRGELLPETMIAAGGVLHVPAALASEYQQGCFAFFADTPASCAPPFTGDPSQIVESHSSASLYNPAYYWLVGWPSLVLPDFSGIYAMRIVSAVLTSFFLAVCFWVIGSWRSRRVPTVGVLVGITPIVLYLMGTVNPNALEFTAGLAMFAGMLSIVLEPNPKLLGGRLTLVVVSAALVCNTRGISPLWVAVLLVLPLVLLTGRDLLGLLRRPGVIVTILLIAISAVVSLWWTLQSNSLGTGPSSGPDVVPSNSGVGLSPIEGFWGLIGNFYGQARQMVGILGWLDTTLHPAVYHVFYAFAGLLVLGVIIWVRGRKLVFVIAMALAFFFLPPLVQAAYVTKGGFIWQGRYTLILLMTLLLGMAACIAASERFVRWRRGRGILTVIAWLVAGAWAFATAYAFATTLRRFASGYATDWPAMLEPGAWVPPLGSVALIALFTALTIGFALYVAIAGRDRRVLVAAPLPPVAGEPDARTPWPEQHWPGQQPAQQPYIPAHSIDRKERPW
ncbi:DUF2142 domain-containing protein [Herbiconiux daphne]|uniref:DUF2142 domain-containing protein n=1 Tax=Herbiconiux daphne TaxID=2970914 RepID=A0ABT2H4R7_9MICO|nr:DUF2142 domain-containing protein [Herbiconiux daphne]MCS5734906.1 DUF2142 domain-containing protein [Herbiconiux daphne]